MEADNQAMRETLEFADRELRMATEDDRYGDDIVYLVGCMRTVAAACRAALAKPPRQCDVGTAEEQIKRWEKFCLEHHEYWKPSKGLTAIQRCNCPCHEGNGCNYFIWAQMPYEADEREVEK
jgi:hypothetical protein